MSMITSAFSGRALQIDDEGKSPYEILQEQEAKKREDEKRLAAERAALERKEEETEKDRKEAFARLEVGTGVEFGTVQQELLAKGVAMPDIVAQARLKMVPLTPPRGLGTSDLSTAIQLLGVGEVGQEAMLALQQYAFVYGTGRATSGNEVKKAA